MAIELAKAGAELFRAYVTDGVPASGAHNPVKADIRAYLGTLEDAIATVPLKLTNVGGTANAITADTDPAIDGYAAGQLFLLVPASANTGATTLNLNGLGAVSILSMTGAALVGGELVAGAATLLAFDGTAMRLVIPDLSTFQILEPFAVLSADRTGNNDANAQAVFGAGSDELTLAADTTYEFEARYTMARTAGTTSHTTSVLFGGTAVLASLRYVAEASNPSGTALGAISRVRGTSAAETVITAANVSATEEVTVTLRGFIRVTTGGTLIPQFKYSAAPGGAPTIVAGSFFRARALGNASFESRGGWA